ncbi:MAG: SpoIIE family protein phosphatase [Clostridia bacterium]|nr:SpoIIE family protein phosphatase [Clostridia bacterium]
MADNNRPYNLANIGEIIGNRISKLTQKTKEALPSHSASAESTVSAAFLKSAALYLLKKSALVLISYLFGSASALFTTYPFGLALLCASSKDILFIYLGLLFAAHSIKGEATAFFLIYTACVIMRFAFSKWIADDGSKKSTANDTVYVSKMFNEPFALRMLTVIICSLSISLARLISDGFLYYDLFALFVCILAAPLLFCAYYYPLNAKNTSSQLLRICAAVSVFSMIYSVRLYYVLNFSLATLAALLVTLYVSKKFGVLQGCVFGLFAGLACSLQSAPMFAMIGFVFGTLNQYSLFAGVAASLLTGLLFGVASNGFSAFSTLLPELALGGAIFLPLSYYDLLPKTDLFIPENIYRTNEAKSVIINEEKLKDSRSTFEAIASSFDALSTTIAALSDRLRRPDVLDIKTICQDSFQKHCAKCSLAGICYGRDCNATFDLMGKFTSALDKKGRIDMSDVPEYTASKCFNILKIVSDANLSYSKHLEKLIRSDKTSIFAIDYKALSKLILDASALNEEEYEFDREMSKKLSRALKYMDIDADGVFAYGKRKLRLAVTGINLSHMKLGAPELRRALENVCETRLTLPVFEIEEDRVSMSAESERIFEVKFAKASLKMESSELNGDTSLSFENHDDCFYFLISDGMGSGREAAMTSRLCAMFLSKLLSAGCAKPIVLELLNGFIRSESEECSATVDLAEFDLLSGKGCFIKSGAAPSYILRDNNLYKLQSKTLPIGILKDTDAEVINFELHDGDIIVMFSDGIASSLEDSVWLTSLLCFDFEDDLDKMAKKILDCAKKDNSKLDDMTVALIKVKKARRD